MSARAIAIHGNKERVPSSGRETLPLKCLFLKLNFFSLVWLPRGEKSDVSGLYYYKNTASKTFTDFFVVEFEREVHVDLVLDTATHNPEEEEEGGGGAAANQPIPVYSPFLWLSSGTKDSVVGEPTSTAPPLSKQLPVFNDATSTAQGGLQYASLSDQIIGLCKADEISDTNHR